MSQHGGEAGSKEAEKWLADNRIYQSLDAVKVGRVVNVYPDADERLPLTWGLFNANPLALAWVVGELERYLAPLLT